MKNTRSIALPVSLAALSLAVRAAVADSSISYTGGAYTQDFNSLWTNNTSPPQNLEPGMTPVPIATAVNTPIDLTGPSQDFFGTIPAISTMTGWYAINFGGNSNPLNYDVSDGSNNGTSSASAALYAFYDPANQPASGNNTALGAIGASETGNILFGMKLVNNSTASLNAISLSYTGQLYHQDTGAKSLAFGYLVDTTNSISVPISGQTTYGALNVGGFATGASGAVATSPSSTENLSVTNLPLSTVWAPGQALWLTWQMGSGGGGQGLAIDNLSFSASSIAGSPTLIWAIGNGTWDTVSPNWAGSSTLFANGSNNASFGTIALDTTITVDAAGVIAASTVTINNSGAGIYTFTGGAIGGAAVSLNLNGGTVKLLSPNTYGLATNINAGTLIVDNNNELGATSAALNLAGGILMLNGSLNAGTRILTVSAAGGTFNTNSFTAAFGPNSASVPVIHGTLHVTGGGDLNLGIQPTFGSNAAPAGKLQIDAGSTVTLTGNSRSGATDMWDGGIVNGALVLDTTNTTGGARFNFDAPGTFSIVGSTATNSGVDGSAVVSGTGAIYVPTGSRWVIPVGGGKPQLSDNSTTTGNTPAGVIISNTSGGLGANIAVNIHLNSLEGTSPSHPTFARTDVSSPHAIDGTISSPNQFITVIGGTKNNGSTGKGGIGPAFANLIISGVISGDSDINIGNDYKSGGSGNVTLDNQNTYHGVTMLNGGGNGTPVLYLGVDNALPTDTDLVFGTLSGAGAPSLDLDGHNQTIQSLSIGQAANSPQLNQINNSGPTPATLTISGAVTPFFPYNGQINDQGPTATDPLGATVTSTGGSTTAVVKDGSSTLVLGQYLDSGHFTLSSYCGGTTVKGGVLQIPFDGALGAPTGLLKFDGGTLSIKTPDLLYNGAGGTSVTFTSVRPIAVTANGGTLDTPSFIVHDANNTTSTASLVAAVSLSGVGGYNWGGKLSLTGDPGSNMTLDGGAGPVVVSGLPAVQVNANVALTVGGTSDPFTDSSDNTKHVAIQNAGNFTVTGKIAPGAITGAGNATVNADASLSAPQIVQNSLTVNGNVTLRPESAGASKLNSLLIANDGSGNFTGKLDLSSNGLILESAGGSDKSAKIASLNTAINSGSANATWTGNGITSSTAAADSAHLGVGVFDNGILGLTSFAGQSLDSNSILTAVAHLGDANRDGVVDLQDLSIVTNHWQTAQNNWAAGDLNRDGVVDLGDLSLVTNNWQQTSSFNQTALVLSAPISGSVAAVPEPASLSLLALGSLLLIRRRKNS